MNRQRLILTILLGILALAVAYSVIRFPRQKKVDKLTFAPGSGASGAKSRVTAGEETRVRLDLLQKNQVGFTGFKKNIFAPIFRDLSKLPPVKPVIPAPPPPPPPPVVTQPTESTVERELAQFTFLGFLDKDRKKTIFLTKNKEIFLVKKGERISGKYEAVAITDDALTIRVLDGGTAEIIIPLIENKALKAPSQHPTGPPSQPQQAGASPQTLQSGRATRRPSGGMPLATEPRTANE